MSRPRGQPNQPIKPIFKTFDADGAGEEGAGEDAAGVVEVAGAVAGVVEDTGAVDVAGVVVLGGAEVVEDGADVVHPPKINDTMRIMTNGTNTFFTFTS